MAQHWTDFSEHSTGTGVPSGWTARWSTSDVTYSIESGGDLGGQILRIVRSSSGGRRLISYDAPGSPGTVEALMKFRASGVDQDAVVSGLGIRGGGGAGSEDLYGAVLSDLAGTHDASAIEYAGGSGTLHGDTSFAWANNDWVWVRATMSGSGFEARLWDDGDPEPGAAMLSFTDSSHSSGWAGIFTFDDLKTTECDWFSVGTSGDSALGPDDFGVTRAFHHYARNWRKR